MFVQPQGSLGLVLPHILTDELCYLCTEVIFTLYLWNLTACKYKKHANCCILFQCHKKREPSVAHHFLGQLWMNRIWNTESFKCYHGHEGFLKLFPNQGSNCFFFVFFILFFFTMLHVLFPGAWNGTWKRH